MPPEDINEPLAFKKAILEAGVVMNTSLVPAPKLTALLLFELDIGVVLVNVFPDEAYVPSPTSKSQFVLSTMA